MKTLYVTDLDGTLLNSNEQLSAYTVDTINQLVAQGMLFTYATARSLSSASMVTKGLSAGIPAITYNGAFIVEPASGERLSALRFTPSETEALRQLLQAHTVSPLVYALHRDEEQVRWIPGNEHEGMCYYLQNRKEDKRMTPITTAEELYDGEIFYCTCIGNQPDLVPVYEALCRDARFRCTLQQEIYRTEYWLEIMPANATKAQAIQTLRTLWQCDRVICFGDAINDLPMFTIADECYAVSNAVPELQQAATAVIGGNDADAVAHWLSTHFIPKR